MKTVAVPDLGFTHFDQHIGLAARIGETTFSVRRKIGLFFIKSNLRKF